MGIPRHSFSTKNTSKVHVLTQGARQVALLAQAARNPLDPDSPINRTVRQVAAQAAADPIRSDPELTLAVRAFPSTEAVLQSLVRSEGFTFWGQSIALILTFCAANPDLAPLEGVEDGCPSLLFSRGGDNRGGFDSPRPSRAILAALSPEIMGWITAQGVRRNIAPAKLAAAILHRHARSATAMIQAANRDA